MGTSDTLRSVIDAGRSSKRLDELSSARVIARIARQLHAAQQKAGAGKAVGPVTPSHIALAPSGEATVEPGAAGTLGYSSPEQANGGAGDRRSDVFSLGTVLWETLTYTRLFDAMNDAAVKVAVKEREITPPAEINANVPAELSAICMRALARDPTDRYQSLKAMAVELEEFLEEAGYADTDAKIAAHLAALHAPAKPARSTPASGTQPPASAAKQERAKTPSGAAIAAALANANANANANDEGALPRASARATVIGVPKLDEWQDASAPAHAPPPAAAPVVSVGTTEPASVAAAVTTTNAVSAAPAASVPTVPLPPVLPSGSATGTTKAQIVDVKREAQPGGDKAKASASHGHDEPTASRHHDTPTTQLADADHKAQIVDTLVDAQPPEIDVPKLVDGKLPESATAGGGAVARAGSQSDAAPAATARAGSQSDAAPAATARAGSQSDAIPSAATGTRSSPHPAAAVSLGPIPGGRESKDVLAGWGWGTDKHEAISAEGYSDDYDSAEPSSKKTLMYVIGGGLALAALVTIIAVGFGGSGDHRKNPKAVAKPTAMSGAVVDHPAPAAAGLAAGTGATQPAPGSSETAQTQAVAADPAEADRLAADKAEADRLAADKAEADRLAADKAAADRLAADKAAKQAEAARIAADKVEAKKAEAARIAADKEAKQAEAARIAADREAKRAEAKRVAAEKAEARRAEAKRVAAEKAEARRAEAKRIAAEREAKRAEARRIAAQKADANKTARAKTAKAEPKTVARAEPKVDPQAAYRTGLQLFARGDTRGALASLRASRAGNPNHAPTWRALGLVFEKMGEKAQARAAFKHYLQLAPGASDADQIRGRLERLGS